MCSELGRREKPTGRSFIDDFRSEKNRICCLYKNCWRKYFDTKKYSTKWAFKRWQFCERDTSHERKSKGVKVSQATPLACQLKSIIIRCKFFFFFIGRKHTTWPANNCLQIIVCSCAMSSNCVWLQIIYCSCVNEDTLLFLLRTLLGENSRSLCKSLKTNSVINYLP